MTLLCFFCLNCYIHWSLLHNCCFLIANPGSFLFDEMFVVSRLKPALSFSVFVLSQMMWRVRSERSFLLVSAATPMTSSLSWRKRPTSNPLAACNTPTKFTMWRQGRISPTIYTRYRVSHCMLSHCFDCWQCHSAFKLEYGLAVWIMKCVRLYFYYFFLLTFLHQQKSGESCCTWMRLLDYWCVYCITTMSSSDAPKWKFWTETKNSGCLGPKTENVLFFYTYFKIYF